MAEKTDWANQSKKELQEKLRRQEKLLANKKLLQSLPDRGDKVIATVAKLQELIARKEQLEDTVAQFERMTVSQLVERTQLNNLDSDDSDDDNPVVGAELHKETDSKHIKKTAVNGLNKSENKQTSHTSARKWNYESSATPPVYNFEKSKSVSLEESFKLLHEQEKRYKDLQAHHATLKLKEQGLFARTDHMIPQVVQNPLQYREAVQDDSPSDDSEQEENETRPTEMDSDDDDDDDDDDDNNN